MERKHRTEVFVMVVSEELPEWEDSQSIGMFFIYFLMADSARAHLSQCINQFLKERETQHI